jgi:hypothetical protein
MDDLDYTNDDNVTDQDLEGNRDICIGCGSFLDECDCDNCEVCGSKGDDCWCYDEETTADDDEKIEYSDQDRFWALSLALEVKTLDAEVWAILDDLRDKFREPGT